MVRPHTTMFPNRKARPFWAACQSSSECTREKRKILTVYLYWSVSTANAGFNWMAGVNMGKMTPPIGQLIISKTQ
jgi:hypothetical protein